ncbi:MAG TPA: carbon-nitrogen hydrolase family protein [Dehalococcoidia bacterium]|nr:carbon-nitrogen hydrolase family protein [Dehalococcoidia bacterium]
MAGERVVRVASVQATPVFIDLQASLDKACSLIVEAGRNGASLVVLPEAFLPCFPLWVAGGSSGARPANRENLDLYAQLLANAVDVPGPVTNVLGEAAREAGAHVVIGVNERNADASGASMYNTVLYFDDSGALLGKHRKLVPTMSERLVWTPGDGSTLQAFDTGIGRLGGLTCWENYMPLARFALYAWGTQIYSAPTWDSSPGWLESMNHIAFEGGCFVLGSCQVVHANDIPDRYAFKQNLVEARGEWINVGNSVITSPRKVLAGPVVNKEETLYADLDLDVLSVTKAMLDIAGHYARPDVFDLTVNRASRPMVRSIFDAPQRQD